MEEVVSATKVRKSFRSSKKNGFRFDLSFHF